jgi:hypothetical protein
MNKFYFGQKVFEALHTNWTKKEKEKLLFLKLNGKDFWYLKQSYSLDWVENICFFSF